MEPLRTPASFAPSAAVSLAPQGLPIPDGRYRLTAVAPKLLLDPSYRLERADTVGTRFDFGGRAIESFRPSLASVHPRQAILIAPEPKDDPVLGFRGLAGHQVVALRRDGFEPAWVVKVGERFDVLLRPHRVLEEADARALRDHLVRTYEISDQRGVFQNAVRLPGHAFPQAGQVHEPALVEVRAAPFSASRAIVTELQQARLRETIEHTARELPKLQELQSVPLVVAETPVLPRPALPSPEHEAMQTGVERLARAYRLPETQELAGLSDKALIDRALEINRRVLASEALPARLPLDLGALESEIAHRRRELFVPLQAVEREASLALRAVEKSWVEARKDPALDTLGSHQEALDRARAATVKVEELSRRWAQLSAAQFELDHDRWRAARVARPEVLVDGVAQAHRETGLGQLRAMIESLGMDPAERLRRAAEQVATGDLSAEALRRLNQAAYAAERVLPEPLMAPRGTRDATQAAEFQRQTLAQVRGLAQRVAQGQSDPSTLGALVQEASHAIGLQRRADYFERKAMDLAEPHPVPKGIAENTWRAAWLQRAEAVGLKPEVAAAHLANAFLSPMLSGQTAMRVAVAKFALQTLRSAKASLDLTRQPGLRQ